MKNLTPLQKRRADAAQQDAQIRAVLAAANARRDPKPNKRKDALTLGAYLAIPLRTYENVREPDEYTGRSYNEGRQILDLIEHLFVRYPTPHYLYRAVMKAEGVDAVFGRREFEAPRDESTYRPWFFAAAQGRSLAPLAKDLLTRKELHWFMLGHDGLSIEENIVAARATAAGVPERAIDVLLRRLAHALPLTDARWPDLVQLLLRGSDLVASPAGVDACDFLARRLRDGHYSLKGRTMASIIKASREWHGRAGTGARRNLPFVDWAPMFEPWEYKNRHGLFRILELTTSLGLAEESAELGHCVWTYVEACRMGRSRIVSMQVMPHKDLASRITIEVAPSRREVVQIRGRRNRGPSDLEKATVNRWATESGLTVSDWA